MNAQEELEKTEKITDQIRFDNMKTNDLLRRLNLQWKIVPFRHIGFDFMMKHRQWSTICGGDDLDSVIRSACRKLANLGYINLK